MQNLKFYLQKARKQKRPIWQFNFSTLEQLKGIVGAAKKSNFPVILATSQNEAKFFGMKEAVFLRDFYKKELKIPIFLNLDHAKEFRLIKLAIDLGYDSVHFDGSLLPLEENIKKTKKIVDYAKKRGVLVEGELGIIGSETSTIYQKKFRVKEKNLTDPQEAQIFVKKTGIDLFAPSIGNFHGMQVSGKNPKLRIDRLKEIKNLIDKNVFLVLHGGSGLKNFDLKEAIRWGIVKININTELRLAFSCSLKKTLKQNPQEIIPYKILKGIEKEIQKVVFKKIKIF